jgi:hypothetical protein
MHILDGTIVSIHQALINQQTTPLALTMEAIPHSSDTVGAGTVIAALQALASFDTVMLAGQVSSGASSSITVTVNVHVDTLPWISVTV